MCAYPSGIPSPFHFSGGERTKLPTVVFTCANRFQSEVLVRIRPNSRTHTLLRRAVHCGEFLAWSPGRWDVGEATAAFCRRSFAVLASSQRAGPEIIEVGNCLATRYDMR